MDIVKVGQTPYSYQTKKADSKKETEEKKIESEANEDKFSKTGTAYTKPSVTGIYHSKVGSKLDASLMDAEEARMQSFTRMIQKMVAKQGQQANLSLFGMDLYVTEEDSANAAASIAEGGEYSVDAVATRLMDMAKALSGGDSSKIEELREAVKKGFEAAGAELGGKLPDISNKTFDEVMKRFDEWAKEAEEASQGIF